MARGANKDRRRSGGAAPVAAVVAAVIGAMPGIGVHRTELMNATGQGWYRYEKAKFLSATFEFRINMAVEQRRKWLREALAELPARLDDLWNDTGYTARERRKILCLLWSEVDVENPDTRVAADIIVSWIAARLPADSPAAYSATELAA